MKKKTKMRIYRKTIFIILSIILATLLVVSITAFLNKQSQQGGFVTNSTFVISSDLFFNYEITKYPSSAEISNIQPEKQERVTLGVVVDPWNLKFGVIPAGNNFATRFIDLTNLEENEAKISFKVYGNISPFVNFSKNNFILEPNESVTVEVNFYATREVGNYSGEIDVVVQRPKYDFLYNFW